MATANESSIQATLVARGMSGAQAAIVAEEWKFAMEGDMDKATKWLASTSVALTPQAVVPGKARPAGTTKKGHDGR